MSNRGGFDNQLLQIEEVRIRWKCFAAAFGEMKSRLKSPRRTVSIFRLFVDLTFLPDFAVASRFGGRR